MNRGATLIELALALTVAGLLLGMALPRLEVVRDSLAVDRAAGQIVGAHRRARMAAILQSRAMELAISPTGLAIRASGAVADQWQAEGPASDGVTLAGGLRRITFSPVGVSMGLSNGSYPLSRGTATRTVVISRLGRVRIVR
jgi:Tfp pilus assembly protein FimT